MRAYLAGRMRGQDLYAFPVFDAVADALRADGHEVRNPADLDRARGFDPASLPPDHDWTQVPDGFDLHGCIREDIDCVLWCDAVVLLPGWRKSTGARAEAAVGLWAMKRLMEWPRMNRVRCL